MPLVHSSSDAAFKTNVKNLLHEAKAGTSKHVKSRDQALAIAYSIKRRGYALGGAPAPWYARAEARSMMHSGPVMSAVPGRTDKHNVSVAAGSYVLPSTHVSSLGQGNTHAGFAAIGHMFGPGGPYGSGAAKIARGPGAPKPPHAFKFSAGGVGDGNSGESVPIVVAGGEYILTPDEVARIGGGDIKHGHEVLDAWVMSARKKEIKTLKSLPGPAKK